MMPKGTSRLLWPMLLLSHCSGAFLLSSTRGILAEAETLEFLKLNNKTATSDTADNRRLEHLFMIKEEESETFLRIPFVRYLLVALYTLVFLTIFICNCLLISALALNRGMLTVTNIFLLNLAIADLCVAIFCVYQNLSLYLLSNWIFGDFLCRMYHFIHAMSYTASICIHMVIAAERYLALVKPFWARVLLTRHRLRLVIVAVWCLSALACSPRFFIYKTIVNYFTTDLNVQEEEILCVISYHLYSPALYDTVYIAIFFACPLCLIGFLYFRISYHLWRSTSSSRLTSIAKPDDPQQPPPQRPHQRHSSGCSFSSNWSGGITRLNSFSFKIRRKSFKSPSPATVADEPQQQPTEPPDEQIHPPPHRSKVSRRQSSVNSYSSEFCGRHGVTCTMPAGPLPDCNTATSKLPPIKKSLGSVSESPLFLKPQPSIPNSRQLLQMERLLAKRRKVIRMMITIVASFTCLSVPFHLRKLLQHFYPHYDVASDLATGFTLLTTLLLYANSAVNPILYMCFSTKLRRQMLAAVKRALCCCCNSGSNNNNNNLGRHRNHRQQHRQQNYHSVSLRDFAQPADHRPFARSTFVEQRKQSSSATDEKREDL